MASGKLRNLIQIRQYTSTRNSYGEDVKIWELFSNAWAEIKPIKAAEFFAAQGASYETTHRIVIRYIEGVKPDMQIVYRGRIFDIVAIRDYSERHRYLEIMAKEVF